MLFVIGQTTPPCPHGNDRIERHTDVGSERHEPDKQTRPPFPIVQISCGSEQKFPP